MPQPFRPFRMSRTNFTNGLVFLVESRNDEYIDLSMSRGSDVLLLWLITLQRGSARGGSGPCMLIMGHRDHRSSADQQYEGSDDDIVTPTYRHGR